MKFDISGNHCSVDLETLDLVPGGVIFSIGAVMFNVDGLLHNSDFYAIINVKSSVDYGLTVDQETLKWWEKQSDEARKVLTTARYGVADLLQFGLGKFSHYLGQQDPAGIWGNGASFDNAFLEVAYSKAGLPPPWNYKKNKCFRTLSALVGDSVAKPDGDSLVKHNALDDAKYQAYRAVSIFQELRKINESQ